MKQKKLSSKLTNMKFMRRKEERITRKRIQHERVKEQTASQWVMEGGISGACLVDDLPVTPSFKAGRRSYRGFNKVVEKIVLGVKAELNGISIEHQNKVEWQAIRRFQDVTGMRPPQRPPQSRFKNPEKPDYDKRPSNGENSKPRKRRKTERPRSSPNTMMTVKANKPSSGYKPPKNNSYGINPDRLNIIQKMCKEINDEDRDQEVDNDSWDEDDESENEKEKVEELPLVRDNAMSFLSQIGGNQFQPVEQEEEIPENIANQKKRTELEDSTGQRMLPKVIADLFGDDVDTLFSNV